MPAICVYKGSSFTQSITTPSTDTMGQTPSQSDEIIGWKTYSSAQFGFRFQYPKDWIVKESGDYIQIIASFDSNVQTFFEINTVNAARESVFDKDVNPSCSITVTTFAGKQAKECKTASPSLTSRYIKITDVKNTNWQADNEISYSIRGTDDDLRKAYDQVLSTFAFTDSAAETTTWKTYTNPDYGFEIKFPSYWNGYAVHADRLNDGGTTIGFNLPYTLNGKKASYADALQIIVYRKNIWPSINKLDGSKPDVLTQNSTYVYVSAVGRDLGGDATLEQALKDMPAILATFKLTK
jgi:hypothetical protein